MNNLQHLNKGEPIAFISVYKEEIEEGNKKKNDANFMALRSILKRSHFGYHVMTCSYINETGGKVIENSVIVFSTPEREQELKDLAFMIGKKYEQDSVLFIGADGVAKHIATKEESSIGLIGSEKVFGKDLSLQDIEQSYAEIGKKDFKIQEISQEVANLYGSLNGRMISESWQNVYKKHGTEALNAWDAIQNKYSHKNRAKESLNRLLQHFDQGHPFAFISCRGKEETEEDNKKNDTHFTELRDAIKRARFDYNKVIGTYEEKTGKEVIEHSVVVFSTPKREEELKDLAFMLGKKYQQDAVMFIGADGVTKYIATRKDSSVGTMGSEEVLGKGLSLQDVEQFYAQMGKKKFKIKNISKDVANLYGPASGSVISEKWQKIYKKYGTDALDVWDSQLM